MITTEIFCVTSIGNIKKIYVKFPCLNWTGRTQSTRDLLVVISSYFWKNLGNHRQRIITSNGSFPRGIPVDPSSWYYYHESVYQVWLVL